MGIPTIIRVLISVDRVRAAAERARPHVLRTPLLPVESSLLKLECLQPTGSFKVRGYFAAALALQPEKLRRGLITVSAGNAAMVTVPEIATSPSPNAAGANAVASATNDTFLLAEAECERFAAGLSRGPSTPSAPALSACTIKAPVVFVSAASGVSL